MALHCKHCKSSIRYKCVCVCVSVRLCEDALSDSDYEFIEVQMSRE